MPPENRLTKRILHSRQEGRELAKQETWGVYGSDIEDYEDTFRGVLEGGTFADIIRARQEQHLPVNVLELMGDGQALTGLDVDNALAVTLSDMRGLRRKRQDQKSSIHLLPGDILSKQTWRNIEEWLDHNTANSNFDLIIVRPVAGWAMIPADPRLHYYLMNRAYQMLSANAGAMYVEFNSVPLGYQGIYDLWLSELANTPGIDIKSSPEQLAFRLTRNTEAPNDLPILSLSGSEHQGDSDETESTLAS